MRSRSDAAGQRAEADAAVLCAVCSLKMTFTVTSRRTMRSRSDTQKHRQAAAEAERQRRARAGGSRAFPRVLARVLQSGSSTLDAQTAHTPSYGAAAAAPSYPPHAAAAVSTAAHAASASASDAAGASAAPVPVVGIPLHSPLVRSDVNSLPLGQHLPPPPGGLYIGNLAWWVTDQDLADLLCPLGELSCIRIVFDKLNGKSRGFAYVEFVRGEDAARAMQVCSTAQLAGRSLDVAPTSYARIVQTHANFKTMPPPRKSVRPNGDGIDYEVAEFVSRAAMQGANKDGGSSSSSGGRDSHRDSSSSGGRGGDRDLMPPMGGGGGPMRGPPYGGMPPPMGLLGMNPMLGPMGGGFMPGMGPMNPMMMGGMAGMTGGMGGGMGMMGPGGRMGGPGPGFGNGMAMMGGMGNAPAPAAPPPASRIRVTQPYEHTRQTTVDQLLLFSNATPSLSALVHAALCVLARCPVLFVESSCALLTLRLQLQSMTRHARCTRSPSNLFSLALCCALRAVGFRRCQDSRCP